MEIINESDEEATWWCYNSDDQVKTVALKQAICRPTEVGAHKPLRTTLPVRTACC
jgi:hypothetical protein